MEYLDDDQCPDCGTYVDGGSYCDECLTEYDYDPDEHSENRRRWIAESNEY